jgi:branched-chain amino acid transport system permease protein
MQKLRVSPDAQFNVVDWTAFVIFMVVIGGFGTIEGPLLGVVLFIILRELLSDLGTLYQIILGLVAIGMMLKAPDGIWGLVFAKNKRAIIPITRRVPADLNEGD